MRNFKERFDIGFQPAAILFVHGVELARLSGAFSEEALGKVIEENYKRAPISGEQTTESQKQTVIEELIESDFKRKVLNSKVPVLLLVSYERSGPGPYQSIRSVLERIARNNPDKIKAVWLNTEDNFFLAAKLDSADTELHLFLFKNGKKQRRLDGNASEDAIMDMLEGYVALK